MAQLSVLIPSRNEMFLARTIGSVLDASRAETEVIAICDGGWPDPPVPDHPKVRLFLPLEGGGVLEHSLAHRVTADDARQAKPVVVGQRAGTNLAATLSTAEYVMKLDAHCRLADGFDVELIRAAETLGRNVTQIPAQINLHAFNWKCRKCGRETYQGPSPKVCGDRKDNELHVTPEPCGAADGFDRAMIWEPAKRRAKGNGSDGKGNHRRTEFWRFDYDLHFQYSGPRIKGQETAEIADVMSSIGACFFMRRDRFWELGGLDESAGSWGQFGTEIACKSWLSGGRHVVNKRTWFAHLFRTQGSEFSFPYDNPVRAVERAREHSRKLWLENTWPGQVRPLSWLIDYFKPIRGWHDAEGRERLALVMERGRAFRPMGCA